MSQSYSFKRTQPSASPQPASSPARAPAHVAAPASAQGHCLQRVITHGHLTTSDDHLKGNPKGTTRNGMQRTQSSPEVIARAQQAVVGGTASHVDTLANDLVFEVPRKNPKSAKKPRRFHQHRGGGDGKTVGFFEVPNDERGANSEGEFSDSEDEGD